MRRARSSIATARTSTPSSARSVRATSASMRCTSTCTRPSPPRTAAAVRVRARWCFSAALAPFAPLPFVEKQGDRFVLVEEETAEEHHSPELRPDGRLPRPDGHVHPRAAPTSSATAPTACARWRRMRCSTPTTSCAASRTCSTRRSAHSGPCMHEALFSDKGFAEGLTTLDRRQGADRRGLPPDDHVLPAGRPRRDAGRADRDREQGGARPVHRRAALARRAGEGGRSRRSRPRRSMRRAAASTRRWRRASRCWSTRIRSRPRRQSK